MAAIAFDVEYTESRSRLTTFFRGILAIPHQILLVLWQYVVQLLAVVQWFIILFTGKRNEAIWRFSDGWLGYASRVMAYSGMMFDPYPAFGSSPGNAPVRYAAPYETEADRLTNALRLIWAIPAAIIGILVVIAASVVTLVSWIAIVVTGRHPRGMFDFLVKAHRYSVRLSGYTLLMTDTYPKYE